MNNKAQVEILGFELNPLAAIGGLICGLLAFWIMGNPFGSLTGNTETLEVGLVWRILSLLFSSVAGYFVLNKQLGD